VRARDGQSGAIENNSSVPQLEPEARTRPEDGNALRNAEVMITVKHRLRPPEDQSVIPLAF
jgi:hypothetical protein